MPLAFGLETIDTIEFGIGRDTEHGTEFVVLPVDANVQQALRDMVLDSRKIIDSAERKASDSDEEIPAYQPSEKYESPEYVVTKTDGDFAGSLKQLHT